MVEIEEEDKVGKLGSNSQWQDSRNITVSVVDSELLNILGGMNTKH